MSTPIRIRSLQEVVLSFHHLASAIEAAFEAYAVVQRGFAAGGIQVVGPGFQLFVGTALIATCFGDFSFRMCHCNMSLQLIFQFFQCGPAGINVFLFFLRFDLSFLFRLCFGFEAQ